MQGYTSGKDILHKVVCLEPALVFDDAHGLRASYGMLNTHPDGGNLPIMFLVLLGKLLPFGFLNRVYDFHSFWPIALVSGILIQGARYGKRIQGVGNLLVVFFARNGLDDKYYQARHRNDDGVLDCSRFFCRCNVQPAHPGLPDGGFPASHHEEEPACPRPWKVRPTARKVPCRFLRGQAPSF